MHETIPLSCRPRPCDGGGARDEDGRPMTNNDAQ